MNDLKEKNINISTVFIRATPVMEVLTGFMIALLIFYSGILIMNNQLSLNNFFSFLAAMMLAYQPVKSLATINVGVGQGLSAGKRILPIIDEKSKLKSSKDDKELNLKNGDIEFKNIEFSYDNDSEKKETQKMITLKNINLKMIGGKMTSLVGHSGSGKSTILNLIPRIYDADLGEITIDEQSIYKLSLIHISEPTRPY